MTLAGKQPDHKTSAGDLTPVLPDASARDDLSVQPTDVASIYGTVTDIQRFSLHDGPGIRTTVFLKGCSLRCFWCHNPECINPAPEIQVLTERCIGCRACIAACAQGALVVRDGVLDYQRKKCVACGGCAKVCYARARVLVGKQMRVGEVMDGVLQDAAFYERSGGGVTISGGEPVLQRDFCRAILERVKAEGIHTALETAGNYRWDALARLLAATDLVMMDIKHISAEKHRAATGVTNERILDNARLLAQTNKPVVFRIPIVPSFNDTPEEVGAIAAFIAELVSLRQRGDRADEGASISVELLPFHPLAADKYRGLSMDYRGADLTAPSRKQMCELAKTAEACGITVQ